MHRSGLILLLCAAASAAESFDRVQPILTTHCAGCHSSKLKTSGFSTSSIEDVIEGGNKHGRAIVPGHPEQSALIRILKGELAPRMPLGAPLKAAEIRTIEAWIRDLKAQAAPVSSGEWRWPYVKPEKPPIPQVQAAQWVRNPIDAFVLKRLEEKKLAPAAEASPRALARRVYFDLIGLPPTPVEMDAFLSDSSNDSFNDAYGKLIDKLLADPRYGERWARHWLDLVRYGETSGLEGDGAIGNAWRYRDWVIDSLNGDLPYDQFVIQQLAGGDEHSKTRNNYAPDVQGHVPVAFLRLAPWDRSNLVADEVRQNYLNEVTTATSSIFLGITAGCARCHDHKYDPIPTKDFYRLQAFLSAVRTEDVEVPYKDAAFKKEAEAKIKAYEEQLKSGPDKKTLDAFETEMLAKLIAGKIAEAKGRELTIADLRLELRRGDPSLFGKAEQAKHAELLEDADRTQDPEEKALLDQFETTLLTRLRSGATDSEARYGTLTVKDLQGEIAKTMQKIFTEEEKEKHRELSGRIGLLQRRIARLKPRTLSVVNVPGPPNGPALPLTHVLTSGDYRTPGEKVEPGFLSAITGNSEPAALETDRYRQFPTRGLRMTLAKWIASPDNPLTARVMANRIWQYHFGRGIVETSSDFGKNGSRPTHPELLDWLGNEFVERGWSIKAMHKLILTSSTYRQAAENPAMKDNLADSDNKLLWRFDRRRLQAEEVRDGLLAISGRLNLAKGGPSVFPPLPADLADFARYGRSGGDMWEANEKAEDNRRRSIYTFQRRSLPQPMMLAFDAPVFSESCDRRSVTTTALQALSMMNGDLLNDEAVHLAERIATEAGPDVRGRIGKAFELILNRPPSADEAAKFAKFDDSLVSICRVLLNSNEFLYLD